MRQSENETSEILPKYCKLYKTRVAEFQPDSNIIVLANGQKVCYIITNVAYSMTLY